MLNSTRVSRIRTGGVGLVNWLLLMLSGAPLAGQSWNDSTVLQLVGRGIEARQRTEPDSSLRSYRTRAHGLVFFLMQAGSDIEDVPRLIKADELDVEVYWQAPASSKQVILGWRDARWLPTDIDYHRDHLGIVTNNFGDLIRIGEGDEVRDVPHPLAPDGPARYDYRLVDSVQLRRRESLLLLHEIEVRPREPQAPRIIGTLSLDAATGALVRFRFSFTQAAYLDGSLEDISVQLDNAQAEQRWWLPWRQEIEIRRRVSWFDFPVRSIIRGRWEIGDYQLNAEIPPAARRGPAIGGLRQPNQDPSGWPAPLAEVVRGAAQPADQQALDRVREEVADIAGRRAAGAPRVRPGVPAISDLIRVNRVQGLALGMGLGVSLSPELTLRPRIAFGTSDERLVGDLALSWRRGGTTVRLEGGRRLRDIADQPLISQAVNSLLAQEGGRDQGDYVLLDRAEASFARQLHPFRLRTEGGSLTLSLAGSVERSHSVRVAAAPARNSYRPNPALGVGTLGLGRLSLEYLRTDATRTETTGLNLRLEAGGGDRHFVRAALGAVLGRPLGPGSIEVRADGGLGSSDLPGYRSFAIGGWGTLLGEPFREWGGRGYGLARLQYRWGARFPALPAGAYVSTGKEIVIAPFVAAGWADGSVADVPWRSSGGIRPVAGLAVEWLYRLIRVESGVSLHTGRVGVSVDISREWRYML